MRKHKRKERNEKGKKDRKKVGGEKTRGQFSSSKEKVLGEGGKKRLGSKGELAVQNEGKGYRKGRLTAD